ncbi:MAG TPA: MiaB/RimO family radical SAM methylthiotransferase [Chitinophagaceae bacterium]|jgi:tRNA-2-methylthio-N6-dimethylallyladenosine synthase|nr:MiaB/RimO family radical SAM methylthiotransferase [Chitinophagaceae bacterium]
MIDLVTDKQHDEARQGEAFPAFDADPNPYKKRFYIESYGCAMNFADSEIVASILHGEGFGATRNAEEADLIFINTCSIREKAEQTVRKRLTEFKKLKLRKKGMLVGVLGCMAERLKSKLLEEEKLVDLVVGPDAYRTLPSLVEEAEGGQKAINVLLSRDETYADISPVRLNSNGVSAFVSIMRGCNNMCSFCVVPFTRGRERSRSAESIIAECTDLFEKGYREVTLLGQNVDSYHYFQAPLNPPQGGTLDSDSSTITVSSPGVKASETTLIRTESKNPPLEGREAGAVTFAMLLEKVALISPLLRVRFSTSHPKDITDEVMHTIAKYENICNYIHLPVQSGSTRVLQLMNRTYTREWYMAKVDRIKKIIPGCGISADIITGFCTEEEKDHQDTLSIMEYAGYDYSYMFFYSERPGTLAQRRYTDDVSLEIKKRRLQEVVEMQNKLSLKSNLKDIGKTFKILIEGDSKKSDADWMGRSSHGKVFVFPKENYALNKGDYVMVTANECTQGTLLGRIVHSPEAMAVKYY